MVSDGGSCSWPGGCGRLASRNSPSGRSPSDAADDVANQLINAFANDDADGNDSTAWQQPGDADAVSPVSILWWDGPSKGGLYGYAEPAIYREPRLESYRVSRWKLVLTRGSIRGRVFAADGSAVSGALVSVYEGKTTSSTADGSFALTDVPTGRYALKAARVISGELQSTEIANDLNVADLTVDLHLEPPADRYRLAQVFLEFWGKDDETFGEPEILQPGPEYFELELGPDRRINSRHWAYRWGGELRVEYTGTLNRR
jgi:hypothetical protein